MRRNFPCESHPDYSRWLSIRQRCSNPNSWNYSRYGAKGITYSPIFDDFQAFADYISKLPGYGTPKVTLDRIEGTKGYEPGNLRWSIQSIQVANQLDSGKGSNRYTGINWSKTHKRWVARVTLNGKTLLAKVFSDQREALEARNKFIADRNLPHPTQSWVGE